MNLNIILIGVLLFFSIAISIGQPILNKQFVKGSMVLYPDKHIPTLSYSRSSKVILATDPTGKPDMKLIMQRYVGKSLSGNQGLIRQKCILQFRLTEIEHSTGEATTLNSSNKKNLSLLPLPIKSTNLNLIYTPISEKSRVLGSSIEEVQGRWSEKYITINLDPLDAQLLEKQIEIGQVALSVEIQVMADGFIENEEEVISGMNVKDSSKFLEVTNHLVDSYVVNISPEKQFTSQIVEKIDINAHRIPLEYAEIEIRCYAFSIPKNKLLLSRKIEIEASGINPGQKIKASTSFSRNKLSENSRPAKFNQIIDATQAFKYRIVDIYEDESEPLRSQWYTSLNWFDVIDVSNLTTK